MTKRGKRVAMAPKGCGVKKPRGRGIAGEPKGEERRDEVATGNGM